MQTLTSVISKGLPKWVRPENLHFWSPGREKHVLCPTAAFSPRKGRGITNGSHRQDSLPNGSSLEEKGAGGKRGAEWTPWCPATASLSLPPSYVVTERGVYYAVPQSSGASVSPDGRRLLYSQTTGSNLMLTENFK